MFIATGQGPHAYAQRDAKGMVKYYNNDGTAAPGTETIFKLVHRALPTLIFLCMEFPYLDKKENPRYLLRREFRS